MPHLSHFDWIQKYPNHIAFVLRSVSIAVRLDFRLCRTELETTKTKRFIHNFSEGIICYLCSHLRATKLAHTFNT